MFFETITEEDIIKRVLQEAADDGFEPLFYFDTYIIEGKMYLTPGGIDIVKFLTEAGYDGKFWSNEVGINGKKRGMLIGRGSSHSPRIKVGEVNKPVNKNNKSISIYDDNGTTYEGNLKDIKMKEKEYIDNYKSFYEKGDNRILIDIASNNPELIGNCHKALIDDANVNMDHITKYKRDKKGNLTIEYDDGTVVKQNLADNLKEENENKD